MPKQLFSDAALESLTSAVTRYLEQRLPQAVPAPYTPEEINKMLFSDWFRNVVLDHAAPLTWQQKNDKLATGYRSSNTVRVLLGENGKLITLRSRTKIPTQYWAKTDDFVLDDPVAIEKLTEWYVRASKCATEIDTTAGKAAVIVGMITSPNNKTLKADTMLGDFLPHIWPEVGFIVQNALPQTTLRRGDMPIIKAAKEQMQSFDQSAIAYVEEVIARAALVASPAMPPVWVDYGIA